MVENNAHSHSRGKKISICDKLSYYPNKSLHSYFINISPIIFILPLHPKNKREGAHTERGSNGEAHGIVGRQRIKLTRTPSQNAGQL